MGINQIVFLAAEADFSERFGKALLNTVMGISIVFIVLLLISAIISCFKYINRLEMKLKQKKENVQEAPVNHVITNISEQEEDVSDDLELIAVITAAIEAYEASQGNTTASNGLYVRSIKRVNKRWQNA